MEYIKRNTYMANYLKKFKCIGPECEDTCCIGWRVDIDKLTYDNYNKVDDTELKAYIFDQLVVKDKSVVEYAYIKMDDAKRCPFLDASMLCKIHSSIGAEYLSKTCWSYPKMNNIAENHIERIGVLSCPEVARLCLLDEKGIQFQWHMIKHTAKDAYIYTLNSSPDKPNSLEHYYELIRNTSLEILQNRKYAIDKRMAILGLYLQNLTIIETEKKFSDIIELTKVFMSMFENKEFDEDLEYIKFNPFVQFEAISILMGLKKNYGITGSRYLRVFNETVQGLSLDDMKVHKDNEKVHEFNVFTSYCSEHEYTLENYTVNEFIREMMPFGRHKSIWDSYIVLCIYFGMLKIHLLGVSRFREELNTDIFIEVAQSLSKEISHNSVIFDMFIKVFKESGFADAYHLNLLTKFPD